MKAIQRLVKYLEYKNIPPTRFEKEIGLTNGYIGKTLKRNSDIGSSILSKIIDNCPDLNIYWLLTGEGEMLKSETQTEGQKQDELMQQLNRCREENRLLQDHIQTLKQQLKVCNKDKEFLQRLIAVKDPKPDA